MKNKMVVFSVIIVLLSYGCATQEAPIEKASEPVAGEAPRTPSEAPKPMQEPQPAEEIKETEKETAKPAEQPVIAKKPEPIAEEKKEEFQIFNPVLTYEGAYNGPL